FIFTNPDYTFEANQTYALVGHNGSGKSTLIQIIYNYNTISKGEINYYLNNKMVEENVQRFMAFAAPYVDLPEELTLQEIIDFHFSIKQKRTNLGIEQLLVDANLSEHTNKMIKHFSSGMKQRAKLILAFATEADLLLLDEPCSNFDNAGIAWYQQCISLLLGKCTIIVASNQLYEYEFCQHTLDILKYK
ncbi:MAG: ATP-binding cassette domain-containing protein, partial [Bacteroidia bacterium]|nr:ATP-binding cassette domain-containing protein [Bacteroidia bacterium]